MKFLFMFPYSRLYLKLDMIVFSGELHFVSRLVQRKSRKQCRCSILFFHMFCSLEERKKGKCIFCSICFSLLVSFYLFFRTLISKDNSGSRITPSIRRSSSFSGRGEPVQLFQRPNRHQLPGFHWWQLLRLQYFNFLLFDFQW
jgi:hypothetical protein